MGKSRETVFGLTFQRDFQCQSLNSSLRPNSTVIKYIFTGIDRNGLNYQNAQSGGL